MIKSSFRLPLLGLAVLIAAGLLLAASGRWRGLFISRGTTEPVFISRSGGAGAEAQPAPAGPSFTSGPTVVTTTATSYDAIVCPVQSAQRADKPIRPELEVEAEELRAMTPFEDAAAQPAKGPSFAGPNMPAPGQNFDGLSYVPFGAGFPPDTNGDVGPNHYIQTVNTSIGIYSKTGTQLCAFGFDDLFGSILVTPSGTPCDANNNGDPVVLYDAAADRWVITDFAWTNNDSGPYYECIAASKTSDPVTGGWWLYALRADDATHNWLNDYPKLGVWPDGIYMAANMYDCVNNCGAGTNYQGSRAWALNRAELYSGGPMRAIVFDVNLNAFTLLPSNLRGAAPPAGRPNFFVANDFTIFALDIFKFHVDWTTPSLSSFTGPFQVPVATYSNPPFTIPTLDGNNLDSLGTRLMMQNQYQNRAGAESLWLSHTVGKSAPNIAGLRWYQLDISGGNIPSSPLQQSTFRPDSKHRWIPSLAVDRDGNMAIGYSVSSDTQNPAIQYTGRLASDPLNTLSTSEGLLIAGGGAQAHNCGGTCERWGDYAAMTIDPVDGCTFWFTTEYYATTGLVSDNWHTRIGSFKYPGCGAVLSETVYLPVVLRNEPPTFQTLTQESFEGAFPSAGWSASQPVGLNQYFWGARDCRALTGNRSAWAMGGGSVGSSLGCGSNYIDSASSWMVYGPFSLAGATAADLNLSLFLNTVPTLGNDRTCWGASIDAVHYNVNCVSGSSGGAFIPRTLDLGNVPIIGSVLGNPSVSVAVVFQSNAGSNLPEGAYVDDIVLRRCVAGPCVGQQSAAAPEISGLVESSDTLTRPDTAQP
jgi:hypothetical protein